MIDLGCHPNTGGNINPATESSPGIEQFLKTIREIRDKAEVALKRKNEMMKKKWDAKKKLEVKHSNGDLVWVDVAHYNTDQPSKKLLTKWIGPFPIIQKVGRAAYKLKIPSTWKSIYPVVNESYLTSYVTSTFKLESLLSDYPQRLMPISWGRNLRRGVM